MRRSDWSPTRVSAACERSASAEEVADRIVRAALDAHAGALTGVVAVRIAHLG